MNGKSIEDHPRRHGQQQQSAAIRSKLKILLLVMSTNVISIYLFSASSSEYGTRNHLWDSEALRRELNLTRRRLSDSEAQLADLHRRLSTTNTLLETYLNELGETHGDKIPSGDLEGKQNDRFPKELKLAVGPHKLPLGFTANLGTDELTPALGASCWRFQTELVEYMTYEVGKECPSDDVFAQTLMGKGCEPLPRRRCHPKSPDGYVEPAPFPKSLWTIPPDTSIVWDAYSCKNYSCLVNRSKVKGSYDCKDCFDLNGREKVRWLYDNGNLDFAIDSVLATKPPGTIRIGLDIGGGTATFAARMRERNITIVTSSMNFDGPFNNFIASRGLVPMHISIAQPLPFFHNTLDIVHSMHVLSNWIPDNVLEFILYDIYRVLRPGGLFWIDHFFCIGTQLSTTYAPMFSRIGFKKLRWSTGRKLDRGIEINEWYISALGSILGENGPPL